MIDVGKTIRRLRSDLEISQQELAAKAGVTPSFMSLLENSKRQPSLKMLGRLAGALNGPEEVLLWDAVELPRDLPEKDRRMCEMAKLIVRRFYEARHGDDQDQGGGENDHQHPCRAG